MPQMMPMMWIFLLLHTIILLIIIMALIYFSSYTNTTMSSYAYKLTPVSSLTNWTWKW